MIVLKVGSHLSECPTAVIVFSIEKGSRFYCFGVNLFKRSFLRVQVFGKPTVKEIYFCPKVSELIPAREKNV